MASTAPAFGGTLPSAYQLLPRARHGRVVTAARDSVDRPARADGRPIPAAALQPATHGCDDVFARRRSRCVLDRPVPRVRRHEPARQRAVGEPATRQREPVPVRAARLRRARHPVPDGGDEPRLLAAEPDRSGLEVAPHARLRRVRARRAARRARLGSGSVGGAAPGGGGAGAQDTSRAAAEAAGEWPGTGH